MGHPSIRHSASLLAALLLAPASALAQRDIPPDPEDPTILRQALVQIAPETIRGWGDARPGDELALPWFDGKQIDAVTDCTRPAGSFRNVLGDVDNGTKGTVILTIGAEEFVGSANLDGRTFRYEHLAGHLYSLIEIDAAKLMPDGRVSSPSVRPAQ